MAKVLVDKEYLENGLTGICSAIRNTSAGEYTDTLLSFPNGINEGVYTVAQKQYDAGLTEGYNSGYGQGTYYAAEQAQGFGAKTNYQYWKHYQDITNLKIPYAMQPTNCQYMFANTTTQDNSLIDLSQFEIDFSKSTSFNYWLNAAAIGKIGTLDTTGCSNLSSLFYNAQKIVTIEHLILKDDGSQTLGVDIFRNA